MNDFVIRSTRSVPSAHDIFKRVRDHLRTQRSRSILFPGGGCSYRGAEGKSCAVGCLITDAAYSSAIEGISLGQLQVLQVPGETRKTWADSCEPLDYDDVDTTENVVRTKSKLLAKALNDSGIPASADILGVLYELQIFHDNTCADSLGNKYWDSSLSDLENKFIEHFGWSRDNENGSAENEQR